MPYYKVINHKRKSSWVIYGGSRFTRRDKKTINDSILLMNDSDYCLDANQTSEERQLLFG